MANNQADVAAAFSAFMAITAIDLHSWTDFNLYVQVNAILIVAMLALAQISYTNVKTPKAQRRKVRKRRRRETIA